MLEDFRNHDPEPTRQEHEWIDSNPFSAALRVAVFVAFAVAIGGYVSLYMEPAAQMAALGEADK